MVIPSHYWTGPLAALVALAVVVLICRWVFAPPARRPAAVPAPGPRDYGLLVPVATARSAVDAAALRGVLSTAGIRCTLTGSDADTWQVRVFAADAERAADLVRS